MSDEAEKLARHVRKIACYEGITQGQGQVLKAAASMVESQARQIENLSEGAKDILRWWDKTLDQLAEREAVIAQVTQWHDRLVRPAQITDLRRLGAIIDASPSVVLADLIREKQAEALKGAADAIDRYLVRPVGANTTEQQYFRPWHAEWLRARAAEYRQAVSR